MSSDRKLPRPEVVQAIRQAVAAEEKALNKEIGSCRFSKLYLQKLLIKWGPHLNFDPSQLQLNQGGIIRLVRKGEVSYFAIAQVLAEPDELKNKMNVYVMRAKADELQQNKLEKIALEQGEIPIIIEAEDEQHFIFCKQDDAWNLKVLPVGHDFRNMLDFKEKGYQKEIRHKSILNIIRTYHDCEYKGEELGRGAQGKVKMLVDLTTGNLYVLKILLGREDRSDLTQERDRMDFDNEASFNTLLNGDLSFVLSKMRVDGNLDHRKRCFVQPFFTGESLRDFYKRHNAELPITMDIFLELGLKLLEALKALHEHPKGWILHRDLKLDNVWIHWGKDGLAVKILDFGFAMNQGNEKQIYRFNQEHFFMVFAHEPTINELKEAGIKKSIYVRHDKSLFYVNPSTDTYEKLNYTIGAYFPSFPQQLRTEHLNELHALTRHVPGLRHVQNCHRPVGTKEYMAPQINAGVLPVFSTSSDLYALGVILKKLSRKTSFPSERSEKILDDIISEMLKGDGKLQSISDRFTVFRLDPGALANVNVLLGKLLAESKLPRFKWGDELPESTQALFRYFIGLLNQPFFKFLAALHADKLMEIAKPLDWQSKLGRQFLETLQALQIEFPHRESLEGKLLSNLCILSSVSQSTATTTPSQQSSSSARTEVKLTQSPRFHQPGSPDAPDTKLAQSPRSNRKII